MHVNNYHLGLQAFEEKRYEDTMEYFIASYEQGEYCKEILTLLNDCFFMPNLEEFMETYEKSRQGITEISYEELPLVFLPISDEKFYIFDLKQNCFCGMIDIASFNLLERKLNFHSMLIADMWDIREMAPYLGKEEIPQSVYAIPSDMLRFASFLQVPGLCERWLANWVIFSDVAIMEKFFQEMSDVYLPKVFVTGQKEIYQKIIWEIHQKRISDLGKRRENIFFSFCIPSYNRGTIVLNTVKKILESGYDSEIEVVVSNNGSTVDTEGYEIIKNMKDSRIRYFEYEENTGFMNNTKQAIELANGKWAALQSDEDQIYFPHLLEYLNTLLNEPNLGLIVASTMGPNGGAPRQEYLCSNPFQTTDIALSTRYFTGAIYSTEKLRNENAFRLAEAWKENPFLEASYIQSFLALMAVKGRAAGMKERYLWIEGKASEETRDALGLTKERIPTYTLLPNRMRQYEGLMDIIAELMGFRSQLLRIELVYGFSTHYWLMGLSLRAYPVYFKKDQENWPEIAKNFYVRALAVAEKYRGYLGEAEYGLVLNGLKEVYEYNKEFQG